MAKGGCASVHIVSVLELAVAKRGLTLPSKLVCSLNIFCEPASIPMPHNFFSLGAVTMRMHLQNAKMHV